MSWRGLSGPLHEPSPTDVLAIAVRACLLQIAHDAVRLVSMQIKACPDRSFSMELRAVTTDRLGRCAAGAEAAQAAARRNQCAIALPISSVIFLASPSNIMVLSR